MQDPADTGLSLVEVVVGMLLFALIAIAILPALAQGVAASSAQSSAATATRFLNALVEEARDSADCTMISGVIGRTSTDGKGASLTSTGSLTGCAPGAAATLSLAVVEGGRTLASTNLRIYIP